jgi:ADP-ribose pyrophosphatase
MRNSKLISRKILFDKYGKKFIVDNLEMPDGKKDSWAYVSSPLGVIIVALDKDKNLILVHQYRYTQKDFTYENPAGGADLNENFLETAKRELLEETGYKSNNYIDLGQYYDLSSETDHHCQFFLATDCEYISPPAFTDIEKYSEMSIEIISFPKIYNSLGKTDSLIKSSEHIAAIFLSHRYLTDNKLI